MKRKNLDKSICPIARTLDVIGDWWSLLIIRDAFLGRKRFSEFQSSLGLAKNILASRLRKLQADGVLTTQEASDGSAYQEYVLTEMGRDLYVVLIALRQWGERHFFKKGKCKVQLVDTETGKPIKPLELRSQDGRLLGPNDLRNVKV